MLKIKDKLKENKATFAEEIRNWLTEKNNIVPNETWMNDLWAFNCQDEGLERLRMIERDNFVASLAGFLRTKRIKMPISLLVELLNANNYKNNAGTSYQGGRGTYYYISSLCSRLIKEGREKEAENVSLAFTNERGEYSWKRNECCDEDEEKDENEVPQDE